MTDGGAPTPGRPDETEERHHYRAVSDRVRRGTLAAACVVLLAVLAVVVVGLPGGEDDPASTTVVPTAPAAQDAEIGAQPRELDRRTAEDQLGSGHVALKVTRTQLLRTRPIRRAGSSGARAARPSTAGRRSSRSSRRAATGSRSSAPYRKNNKVAWTKVDEDARFVAVEYSIAIRLQTRDIIVRKDGRVIRRFRAAVGQPTHPTPPGRYAVTDGLIFNAKVRGPYGCCALVLSAGRTSSPTIGRAATASPSTARRTSSRSASRRASAACASATRRRVGWCARCRRAPPCSSGRSPAVASTGRFARPVVG